MSVMLCVCVGGEGGGWCLVWSQGQEPLKEAGSAVEQLGSKPGVTVRHGGGKKSTG